MISDTKRRCLGPATAHIHSMADDLSPQNFPTASGRAPGNSPAMIAKAGLKFCFPKTAKRPKGYGGTAESGPTRTFPRANMAAPISGNASLLSQLLHDATGERVDGKFAEETDQGYSIFLWRNYALDRPRSQPRIYLTGLRRWRT